MGYLFVYVDCLPLAHAASRFSVKENLTKKTNKRERIQERVTPGWTDISGEGPVGFLIQKFHVL